MVSPVFEALMDKIYFIESQGSKIFQLHQNNRECFDSTEHHKLQVLLDFMKIIVNAVHLDSQVNLDYELNQVNQKQLAEMF